MNLSKFLWEKAHWLTKVPGIYPAYLAITNLLYPDGKVVHIQKGPLAGMKWQRFRCHQAWMAMGMYEPHVAQLIEDLLQPGDIFYDIGANAGYFTLVGAKKVMPSGKVFAFEPVPFNATVIKKQIQLNGLQEYCVVKPLAVSNCSKTVLFTVPQRNANAHIASIDAPNVNADGEQIEVKTVTLDEFVQVHPFPTLIKMDIEGAEVVALEGAETLLSDSNAPIMLISTHSEQLDRNVKQLLSEYGYTIINLPGFEQMVYARPERK